MHTYFVCAVIETIVIPKLSRFTLRKAQRKEKKIMSGCHKVIDYTSALAKVMRKDLHDKRLVTLQ